MVERNAGEAIGFTNEMYQHVGATIVETAKEVYKIADMIVKVKEPQLNEYPLLREDQILFTYLHLAPDLQQTEALMSSGVACCCI